jgi:hypothetical protein
VRSVFKTLALLWLVAEAPMSWAISCGPTLAVLGTGSEREPILRKALLAEMARLYSEALQNESLMPAFEKRLQEMAVNEQQPKLALYKEIEALAPSPAVLKDLREAQEAIRREEQSRLSERLEPYLYPIGRTHREVIESTLIRPGLVYPLITGEVEFQFMGSHQFVVGDERYDGWDAGKSKMDSFGPKDNFAIGQVPVTQLLYFLAALGQEGVEATPSRFKSGEGAVVLRLGDRVYSLRPNHPVEGVSYDDAEAHTGRVSELTDLRYGLPSGVRWEFANRAGSQKNYHFGDDVTDLPRYAWFDRDSGWGTHEVGELLPNAFQLFDTHGNVWEWTSSGKGGNRDIRGGGWYNSAELLRSAYRINLDSDDSRDGVGFRLERRGTGNARPAHTFTLGEPESEAKPPSEPATSSSLFYKKWWDRFRRFGK